MSKPAANGNTDLVSIIIPGHDEEDRVGALRSGPMGTKQATEDEVLVVSDELSGSNAGQPKYLTSPKAPGLIQAAHCPSTGRGDPPP